MLMSDDKVKVTTINSSKIAKKYSDQNTPTNRYK